MCVFKVRTYVVKIMDEWWKTQQTIKTYGVINSKLPDIWGHTDVEQKFSNFYLGALGETTFNGTALGQVL